MGPKFWKRDKAKDVDPKTDLDEFVDEADDDEELFEGATTGSIPTTRETTLWSGVRQRGVFDVFQRQGSMLMDTESAAIATVAEIEPDTPEIPLPSVPHLSPTLEPQHLDAVRPVSELERPDQHPEPTPTAATITLRRVADGASYTLEEGVPALIGRGKACDVCITDDFHLSRRQAAIVCLPDKLIIMDLGSANGTWVNGVRLKERQQYELAYQQPFFFSKSEFVLVRD